MPAARYPLLPLISCLAPCHRSVVVLAIVLCVELEPSNAEGQGTRADYERAATLRQRAEGAVFKMRVTPHWDADGARFWYRNDLAGGCRAFIRVDADRGTRRPAFDHARLAAALSRASDEKRDGKKIDDKKIDDRKFDTKKLDPERLPIEALHFEKDDECGWPVNGGLGTARPTS